MARRLEEIIAMKRIQKERLDEVNNEVQKIKDKRYSANKKILELLNEYFEENKDIRFHQGLQVLFDMNNNFQEESVITLDKLIEKLS